MRACVFVIAMRLYGLDLERHNRKFGHDLSLLLLSLHDACYVPTIIMPLCRQIVGMNEARSTKTRQTETDRKKKKEENRNSQIKNGDEIVSTHIRTDRKTE